MKLNGLAHYPVHGLRYFKTSDMQTYKRLYNALNDYGVVVDKRLSRVNNLVGTFYEYYWAPPQKGTIIKAIGKQQVINGYGVPHHAIHILCFQKYKHGFRGYPHTLALIESLCSSLDTYFEMYKLQRGHIKPAHPNLKLLRQNYRRLHQSEANFINKMERFSHKPFETYKRTVTSMFDMLKFMHENHQRFQIEEPGVLRVFERMLKKPYAFFHYHYHYAMFVFYLMAIGGNSSTAKDRKTVQAILDHLNSCKDMNAFIDGLMIGKNSQGGRH